MCATDGTSTLIGTQKTRVLAIPLLHSSLIGKLDSVMAEQKQLILYTKPNCVQCEWTKRLLEDPKHPVPYTEVNVTKDKEADRKLQSLGIMSLPYIETPSGDSWFGFREGKIRGYAAQFHRLTSCEVIGAKSQEDDGMKSPYIDTEPDNDSALVVDIHADGIRVYVDRKLSPADCQRLARTLTDAADAADTARRLT